jgi:NDP-sugar pyrophosphorylase family protein
MNESPTRVRRAVILAAGKGSRLESLKLGKPKPAIEVGGKPLILYHLEQCRQCGVEEVYINLHHLPEQIRSIVGDGSKWDLRVKYKFEPVLAGTAGGVKGFSRDLAGEPFLVIYGDNYLTFSLAELISSHFAKSPVPADMSIALFEMEYITGSGVVVCDQNHLISSFLEKPLPEITDSRLVNAGVYLMEPPLLDLIPEGINDFGHDIIPAFLGAGKKLLGVIMKSRVYAVDTPELLEKAKGIFHGPQGDGVADKSRGA